MSGLLQRLAEYFPYIDFAFVLLYRNGIMANRRDDRDFKEEPVDWRELKEFVVDQVKRAGRRIDSEYVKDVIRERGGNVDRVLDKLADKGYLAKSDTARPPSHENRYRHTGPPADERNFGRFRDFRKRLFKKADRALTGFRVHGAAFAGSSVFFFVLWILTGFGHPWFLYPILVWGIGLSSHLNVVIQRLRQRREVDALPDLTNRETRYLQRMHRRRTGFAAHLTASGSLAGFLVVTDIITGGFFPWSLIPAAVLGFGVFLHWSATAPKIRKMKREVRGWITGDGRRHEDETVESLRRDPPVVQDASSLRRTIIRQIEDMEKDHPEIGDMRTLLDTYFQQVQQLATKSVDINSILEGLPAQDLQRDRVKLKNRMDNVQSERLKQEYENSILEIDRQLASVTELSHNGEMLELRLTSAVNLMKQLQLDLARVKGKSLTSTSSFGLMKEKSDELSRYLEDLEAGYDELESDF